jgi:hypothetical protein
VSEAVGPDKLAGVVYPAAAEVEDHGGEPGTRQPVGQPGEHPPVLEPLESVDDDDGRPRRVAARGADVDRDLPERAV